MKFDANALCRAVGIALLGLSLACAPARADRRGGDWDEAQPRHDHGGVDDSTGKTQFIRIKDVFAY